MSASAYLTTLSARQAAEGWSDRRMARELGVGASTWTRIKGGERGIGTEVLRRMMARFPEYNAEAMFFLSCCSPVGGISVAGQEQRDAA